MSTFEKTGWKEGERRTAGTFTKGKDVPVKGEAWKKLNLYERCNVWIEEQASDCGMAGIVYVFVVVKLILWALIFRYAVMDTTQALFTEHNAKRLLLYNVIGDVIGFNSTWGILGMRFHIPFCGWYNMITPGTLTVPLLPGIPGLRSKALVAQYVVYVLLMLRALYSPVIGFDVMWPPLVLLAIMLPQDFNLYLSNRGEHYVYIMVCMLFDKEMFHFGWAMVQIALWTGAGISKLGPWFKYVTSAMMPNCVLLRKLQFIVHMIHKSPTDPTPTFFCSLLSHFGTVTELAMGVGCCYYPVIFVPLTVAFHLYIFSMFPFASVMEWNIICQFSCVYLFHYNEFSWPANVHPCLAGFLTLVLVIVPVTGQIFPKYVPFLLAYRPYAGNWRFSFTVLTKGKPEEKLKKLKTLESPLIKENVVKGGGDPLFASQWDEQILASHMLYPHYRPFLPMAEAVREMNKWDVNDMHILQQEGFFNCIYGWSLGTGYYVQKAHFDAMQEVCQFQKGECYTLVVEPVSLLGRTCEWWAVDNADAGKKVLHGTCQYSQLEEWGLTGMPVSAVNNLGEKKKDK